MLIESQLDLMMCQAKIPAMVIKLLEIVLLNLKIREILVLFSVIFP